MSHVSVSDTVTCRPLVCFRRRFGALHDPQSEQLRETLGRDMPSLSLPRVQLVTQCY